MSNAKAIESLQIIKNHLNSCDIEANPAVHVRKIADLIEMIPMDQGGLSQTSKNYPATATIQGH